MKIESLIKRQGGTIIDMDAPKRQYHFKPDGQHEDPHVCDVDVDSHISALLRIREGFRSVDGEELPGGGKAEGFLGEDQRLNGSTVHSAQYEIAGGEHIILDDLVVMAFEDSGLTYEGWQALVDQERYDYIDATLRELQAGERPEDEHTDPAPEAPQAEKAPEAKPDEPADEVKEKAPENEADPEATEKQDDKVADPESDEGPTRKELVAQFKAKFGRNPSTKLSKEDIAAALSEED